MSETYAGEIVEKGPAKEILENPAHPYLETLITAYQGSEPSERVHYFTVVDTVLASDKTVNLQFLNLDSKTGEVLESTVSINLNHETPAKAPIAADTAGQFDEGTVLAQFKTYKVGDVARGNVALRDLDKFWDAQGRFMLTDPQSLTLKIGRAHV